MAENRSHAPDDFSVAALLKWVSLTLALIVAAAVLIYFMLVAPAGPDISAQTEWEARGQGAEPRLSDNPAALLKSVRAREKARLQAGPMPIGEAMRRTAETGWRAGDPAPSPDSRAARNHPEAAR